MDNLEEHNFIRSGTFLFFKEKYGDVYIICAIDKVSGNYCDFGGGVKKGETVKKTICRELYEESSKLIKLNEHRLFPSLVLVNKKKCITFIEITKSTWCKFKRKFVPNYEVNGISALSLDVFINLLQGYSYNNRKMWKEMIVFFKESIHTYKPFLKL